MARSLMHNLTYASTKPPMCLTLHHLRDSHLLQTGHRARRHADALQVLGFFIGACIQLASGCTRL